MCKTCEENIFVLYLPSNQSDKIMTAHFNFADYVTTQSWGVTFGFRRGNRARFNIGSSFTVTSGDGFVTIHDATFVATIVDGGNSLLPNGDNRHTFNARPCAGNNITIYHGRRGAYGIGRRDRTAPCGSIWSSITNGGGCGIAIHDPAYIAASNAANQSRVITLDWGWAVRDGRFAWVMDANGVHDRVNVDDWNNIPRPSLWANGRNRVTNAGPDALLRLV